MSERHKILCASASVRVRRHHEGTGYCGIPNEACLMKRGPTQTTPRPIKVIKPGRLSAVMKRRPAKRSGSPPAAPCRLTHQCEHARSTFRGNLSRFHLFISFCFVCPVCSLRLFSISLRWRT